MRNVRPHVPALNGIRFVAAFCVIFGYSISSFKGFPTDTIYSLVNLANAGMSLSRSLIRYLFIGRQKSPETYGSAL